MVDQICCEFYCKKVAKYECNCSKNQTFWCHLHIVTHIAYSNKDHPTKLIPSTKMAVDNAEREIQFLANLKIIWLLENEVRSHWLAKIIESPEKVYKLKTEFNRKIKDIENWCSRHKNKEDLNIVDLEIGTRRISELIQNNFEAKHFFRICKYCIWIYGVETRKKLEVLTPPIFWLHSQYAQAIEIPNSKVFCFLRYTYACIIDLKTMSYTKMQPSSSWGDQFTLTYYENCVYAFVSASNSPYWNSLEKYDLISYRKIILPKPPIRASCNLTCAIHCGTILFCAKNNCQLYKFDLQIRSYSVLTPFGLLQLSLKTLFTANMRAYICEIDNGIFESGVDDDFTWNKICEYEKYYYKKGTYLSSENSVYFSSINERYSMIIYKFDLGSKKLYKVKRLADSKLIYLN